MRPIALSGARNGVFSDKIVVGSAKPIRGLKAIPGELRGPGGTIPASALRVRYGVAGGTEYGVYESTYGQGPNTAAPAGHGRGDEHPAGRPARVSTAVVRSKDDRGAGDLRPAGAVAPLWLTVKIPADARPGIYEGNLTVSCEGEKPVEVPVRLDVAGWTLPDPDAVPDLGGTRAVARHPAA